MWYSFPTSPNNVITYWPPNLLFLGTDPHQSLTFLAQKYGPLMYVPLGSIPSIVVSSPVMSKEFLKTHDHVFKYIQFPCVQWVFNLSSITASSSSYWRYLDKICSTQNFTCTHLCAWANLQSRIVLMSYNNMAQMILSKWRELFQLIPSYLNCSRSISNPFCSLFNSKRFLINQRSRESIKSNQVFHVQE